MADGGTRPLDLNLAGVNALLVLAADVVAEEVEALAVSRFAGAALRPDGDLELLGQASLSGPFEIADPVRAALDLPDWAVTAYVLDAPVERGGPVPEALLGRGGVLDAFPDGPPVGTELDAVNFVMAAARRLAGAVRFPASGVLLAPDPNENVDLVVYSEVWLHPDALVAVLREDLPGVALAADVPAMPVPTPAIGHPLGEGLLDEGERAWIHAEADAFDAAAMALVPVSEAYGASAPARGGVIEVTVQEAPAVPLVLQGYEWATHGVIAYEVRWHPADPEAYYAPEPTPAVLEQRLAAGAIVEVSARRILAAVGGDTADDDGFLVDL